MCIGLQHTVQTQQNSGICAGHHVPACRLQPARARMPLRLNRWWIRSAATAAAPAFSPPGAFGLGDDNTNDCPQGLARMANESACQSAVTVAGSPYTYGGSIAVDYLPRGCVWFKAGGGFYFNAVTTGAPRLFAQPVCAGAPHLLRCQRYRSAAVRQCRR
jgi:hypothetical protein